ncbi:MAG: RNase adapter RapZ [Erysipelotrichaceae bacterium]|nr:RNase adapter RapZ [Erysipelotrichaceae bacterium]
MSLLILSGISGAGKTSACHALEDMGYFCIDNLPPSLLLPIARLQAESQSFEKMLVVIDSRSQQFYEDLPRELELLRENGYSYKLCFIYCRQEIILNRYKQTRRKHPMASDDVSLEEAIAREYEITAPIMASADFVFDTTYLTVQQFKQSFNDAFNDQQYKGVTLKLISFGYRNGLPADADLVIDVRCLPNPYYVEELKQYSGLDDCVYDYIFSFDQSKTFTDKLLDFIRYSIPFYSAEGKNELIIAIGCTSGHHRSVAVVRYLQQALANTNNRIITLHRDVAKTF